MIKNRDNEIRLQIEEYREKLKKMNSAQLATEWNRVMLWLNPGSSIKERIINNEEEWEKDNALSENQECGLCNWK